MNDGRAARGGDGCPELERAPGVEDQLVLDVEDDREVASLREERIAPDGDRVADGEVVEGLELRNDSQQRLRLELLPHARIAAAQLVRGEEVATPAVHGREQPRYDRESSHMNVVAVLRSSFRERLDHWRASGHQRFERNRRGRHALDRRDRYRRVAGRVARTGEPVELETLLNRRGTGRHLVELARPFTRLCGSERRGGVLDVEPASGLLRGVHEERVVRIRLTSLCVARQPFVRVRRLARSWRDERARDEKEREESAHAFGVMGAPRRYRVGAIGLRTASVNRPQPLL